MIMCTQCTLTKCLNSIFYHFCTVGGGLDTCLVSTCDGVGRLPWKEVVYPKFIHDPSEELGLMANHDDLKSSRLPSEGDSSLGVWGGSSSGKLDSWSWDEEEDDSLPPYGMDPVLRRRRSEDGLGRTARQSQLDGDYVELLEPRGGPDGGADSRQRYLEMHGICKTKTLPLCRRGKAIRLRKGKAWTSGKTERSGSFRANRGTKGEVVTPKDCVPPPKPPRAARELGRVRRSYSSSVHDSDEGDKISRGFEGQEGYNLYIDGQFKERRPGVGRERDSNGFTQPFRDDHKSKDSQSSDSLVTNEIFDLTNHKAEYVVEGQSDHGSHSDSVFEDNDKPLSGDSNAITPTSDAPERLFTEVSETEGAANSESIMKISSKLEVTNASDKGKIEERVCPRGKEVKTAGFRAPRYKDNTQLLYLKLLKLNITMS